MESARLARLPKSERFIGNFMDRAVSYETSRRCFFVHSAKECIEVESFGRTAVDFADVIDRYLVVVCEDDDGSFVHVFDILTRSPVFRNWLPFWVRCGTSSSDALVLSGENGIALINKGDLSFRTALSGSDYGRISLRAVLASDRWLIGGSSDLGAECRRLDDLELVWSRGDHLDMVYVTELQAFDCTSHVELCSDSTSRRVELVDSATGSTRWSMETGGSLVAIVAGVVLLRSGKHLIGPSVSGHRTVQSWREEVSAEVVTPVSGGCWIQREHNILLLDALGCVVARLEADCNSVLVGAADGVVFIAGNG